MIVILRVLFLLLIIVIGLPMMAQSSVYSFSGRVVDAKGVGLAGTSISIRKGKQGTVTNERGEFVLSGIPAGKYKVSFIYIGCKKKDTIILFNGSVNDLVISLCANTYPNKSRLKISNPYPSQNDAGRNEE